MGATYVTIEVGDVRGERFEAVEVMVDAGSTYTALPGSLLRRLGVPVVEMAQSELADGRVEPVEVGDTIIRLEGRQFPTPVIFGGKASLVCWALWLWKEPGWGWIRWGGGWFR